jgi:transposase InsO family protein
LKCDWKYVKELYRWLCCYIDVHLRFIVSAKLYDNATSGNTVDCLLDGIRRYGTPRQILTDHGSHIRWAG